jgi:2-furoate---CoA ligase
MDLGTTLAQSCARDPDAVAVVDGDTRLSFAAWYDHIRATAGGLHGMGLARGDHVVAVMPNRLEMASLYWACQLSGLIFTPFNWRATSDEIAFVLADAEAKAVAFDAQGAEAVGAAADRAGLDHAALIAVDDGTGDVAGGTSFAALARSAPVAGPAGADDSDICLMLYTSGTTGRPKGVPRCHRAERIAAESCIANQHYREGESALGVMPLFHTMGIRILLASMMLGGKFVCMRAFEVEAALGLIAAERLTALFLVPTMYHDMLGHPRFTDYDCASVRNLGYAGMAMTGALEDKCRALLRPEIFCNYYGSTEIFTFTTCDYLDRKPGCAGRAGRNQGIRVVVADPDGAAGPIDVLAPGEVGEVIAAMSSPEAFAGYWKRPDADAKAIRDGWYFTGDLGWLDDDGDLTLAGRIDDMIISGGENIHPEEVEDTLDASPLVRRAAVVGLEDERWGQKVTAFVEPAALEATADALDAHCRASALARFKRPRAYVFVKTIPKSASGKLLRRMLRTGEYEPLPDYETTLGKG